MQNLMTLKLSPEQLEEIDRALQLLEQQLQGLRALDHASKSRIRRLGNRTDTFCRNTLEMLADNPALVPPSLDVADALGDLNAREQLRPRLARLSKLLERGNDTMVALGSDAMIAAVKGYGLLKLMGQNEGLQSKRKELASQLKRTRRAPVVKAAA